MKMNAHTMTRSPGKKLFVATCVALVLSFGAAISLEATSVLDAGLTGDGESDDTAALQKAFADGKLDLHFPTGTYLLGTIEVPKNASLHFSQEARVKVEPAK